MPCRDPFPEQYRDQEMEDLQKQNSFLEASLCAVLNVLEKAYVATDDFFDAINYEEAGIERKDLVTWRTSHIKKDGARREQERKERVRKAALEKLSTEEKEILGIRD